MPESRWRREPFRVFFPLGVLIAWVGVGHWLVYDLGVTRTYSCELHGLVQMQAFLMAFAAGFLLTAIPRRTSTRSPAGAELALVAAALATTTMATLLERRLLAEAAYLALLVLLVRFAVSRFRAAAGARRPPAAFVLVPIALAHGAAGGIMLAAAPLPGVPASLAGLGRLCVEQGVFLCLVVGVGGLVLPLMAGAPPPPDLGAPGEGRRAVVYAAAGAAIAASLVAEYLGFERAGPLVRAAVVSAGLGAGGGAWRPPGKPGFHRRLVWVAAWLIPAGLVGAALVPSYRVPALHVTFIGGFALMAFGVATHVTLAHLGLDALATSRPRPLVAVAVLFALALLARLAADASHTYFDHLAWASGCWIAGSAVWLAFLGPRLLGR